MTGGSDITERLDRAIDALLRGEEPARVADSGGDLTSAARTLRDVLPRFHPRFGFEELLADRLAALARAGRAVEPAMTPAADPIPLPVSVGMSDAARGWGRRRRGLVAGGAIASGVSLVIPLAGAAIVMWRRSRSSGGWL